MSTSHKILRIDSVIAVTGLARSSIYKAISDGLFPSPILLGARSVGWLAADIQKWLDACIERSRPSSR